MQEAEDRLPTLFLDPLMRFFIGLACFIALINGRWDLTFLSVLLLSMAYGAKIWSRLSLNRVICSSKVDKTRVFPKESLNLEVQVEELPIQDTIQMETTTGGVQTYQRYGQFKFTRVAPNVSERELQNRTLEIDEVGLGPSHGREEGVARAGLGRATQQPDGPGRVQLS